MLGFIISVLSLSFILAGATVSDQKVTALKFGDDGYSVISYSPNMSPLAEKFSFCLWARQLQPGSSPAPVLFAYAQAELFIRYHDGSYRLFETTGIQSLSSGITPGVSWYQYCGTWSLASRTFKAYINGTLAGTYTTPAGRALKTGGTLVVGDYKDYVDNMADGWGSNAHFGGEMYNLNMFSKELTGTEVAGLSADGLCTQVPEQLEDYRVIKWEEILKITRRGTAPEDIEIACDESISEELSLELSLNRTQAELLEVKRKLKECELQKGKQTTWENGGAYGSPSVASLLLIAIFIRLI